MRIGIDASCWSNKRGFGRFTRELLTALFELDRTNDYLLFIDNHAEQGDEFPESATTFVVRTEQSPVEAASASGRRSLSDILAMSREVFRHKVDVFFFPTVYSYFPVFNRAKTIVTIHDVIADLHPELTFPNTKSKIFWKLKQNAAIKQADLIATVSNYSKRAIVDYFHLPESKMRLISEAARPEFGVVSKNNGYDSTLAKYDLNPDDPFLLYVGGISPHKNLGNLISSFKQIVDGQPTKPLKLILVGDYDNDPFFSAYPTLKEQVTRGGIEQRVTFTGFVPDKELAYLYNAAQLLVFPSFEEGFGLPAIEAMACGTPVVASKTGSLPEIAGDAGLFFDPYDVGDISRVIKEVLGNESLRLRMKFDGLARSKSFSWQRAAEDTLRIFRELHPHDRTN